jgi:predicted lipoprotein with Yx(FWY)xxD motif
MSRIYASYALIVAGMLSGCARGEKTADTAAVTSAPDTTASTTAPAPAAPTVSVSINTSTAPKIGRYLTDANGRSLYVFLKDQKNVSTCVDACAAAWPPFAASSTTSTDSSVKAALVGTISRSDGKSQSTYNGMPVYYYEDDKKPGDITGQGKNEFGGLWYVVSPSGQRIEKKR